MNKNYKDLEITRIKEEYARREREIPSYFYSLKHPANLYIYTQRIRAMVSLLNKESLFPLNDKFILDIGCGSGDWLIDFQRWGADQNKLYGVDLLPERIKIAKKRLPFSDLRIQDASDLPWQDNTFDIVLQSLVFTSILDNSLKQAIANEMIRVLKPNGIILWYDFLFNNPKNPNTRGIKAKEIKSLFLNCKIKLKRITLAPPIVRFLAKYSYFACLLLENLIFLNTHYLGIIKPNK